MLKKFLFLLLFVLTLVACSNDETTSDETTENESGEDTSSEPADPFGAYDETVTISIAQSIDPNDTSLPAGDTPLDNQYTRNIKENLNIDFEHAFTTSPSNMDQKISLAIANNDLPDAMVVGEVELRQMVEADQIADLTEVYENYASPLIKEIIDGAGGFGLEVATFDGKLMAIPESKSQTDGIHNLWIRQDWLDKLGLEPPKTVEELKEVAKAFVEEDPDGNGTDDTIGLAGPDITNNDLYATFLESSNNLYGFDGIFSALHAYPGYWIEGDDGKPVYGSILPETKEALSVLRDMYSEGLIDQEMGIREDSGQSIVSGETGMFFGPWWMGYDSVSGSVEKNPEANWQAYPILDADGEYTPHMSTTTTNYLVVRKGYEHPEAPMKVVNNYLAEESKFDPSKGSGSFYPLRHLYAPVDNSEFTVKALREVLAGTKEPEDFYDMPAYKLLKSDIEAIQKIKLEPYDNMNIEYWDPEADWGRWQRAYSVMVGASPQVDSKFNGVKSLTYSQTETMQQRWVNLEKLEDETFMKIIMGSAPLEAFDQFVEDWKQQGGEKITQEVDEVVNR